MSTWGITKRVNYLGEKMLDIDGLIAHDCRHYWATDSTRNETIAFNLQEASGWTSLAMPTRYIEAAEITNEGFKLSD